MSNPVCISPLKFYDSPAKQNHRKSYAHGHISPLITKLHWLPPFQFVIPSWLYSDNYTKGGTLSAHTIINGYYVRNNNTLQSASEYKVVVFDVQGIDKLFVKGTLPNTSVFAVCSFSQNDDGTNIFGSISWNSSSYDMMIDVPQNAHYMYITFAISVYPKLAIRAISVQIYNAKTDRAIEGNRLSELVTAGFSIQNINNFNVAIFKSISKIFTDLSEGLYYLKIASSDELWIYYSEVFCFTEITRDLIEIEYWNETGDFNIKNGIIAFVNNFHFKLLLKSELGKPEYSFEEESTKRLGYVFIESQVSKKVHKFNTVVPEFICDAMRLIRLCDNKLIRSLDEEYDAMSFEMEAEWQTQGDLASVNCEFETDNVVVNLGGFIPDKLGGDFNNDHNIDFDNQ